MSLLSLSPVTSLLSPAEPMAALDIVRILVFGAITQQHSSLPVCSSVDVVLTATAAGHLPHVTNHYKENTVPGVDNVKPKVWF